jgi:hypothetical protein
MNLRKMIKNKFYKNYVCRIVSENNQSKRSTKLKITNQKGPPNYK